MGSLPAPKRRSKGRVVRLDAIAFVQNQGTSRGSQYVNAEGVLEADSMVNP